MEIRKDTYNEKEAVQIPMAHNEKRPGESDTHRLNTIEADPSTSTDLPNEPMLMNAGTASKNDLKLKRIVSRGEPKSFLSETVLKRSHRKMN